MAASDNVSLQQFVFHGTSWKWPGGPAASHDRPFHTSTSRSLAASYTNEGRGVVRKYAIHPDAHIIHEEGDSYASGGNTDEAVARAREAGADATSYRDSVVAVYNPNVLTHVEDSRH